MPSAIHGTLLSCIPFSLGSGHWTSPLSPPVYLPLLSTFGVHAPLRPSNSSGSHSQPQACSNSSQALRAFMVQALYMALFPCWVHWTHGLQAHSWALISSPRVESALVTAHKAVRVARHNAYATGCSLPGCCILLLDLFEECFDGYSISLL